MATYHYQTRVEHVTAIQWTGDNLREVLDFTGKAPGFDNWFDSFEEYEDYVAHNGDIFKLFYATENSTTVVKVTVNQWLVRDHNGVITVWDESAFRNKFEDRYAQPL
ncbi:MAG: hypothetical protein ACK5LG_21870 [Bacteroides thetaiotaomicron]